MTVAQAQDLVRLIIATYPEAETSEETFATYVRFLIDLDHSAVEAAVEGLITTSLTMPTVAAIRRLVITEELRLPSGAEAWVAVSEPGQTEELHELAKEAPNRLMRQPTG